MKLERREAGAHPLDGLQNSTPTIAENQSLYDQHACLRIHVFPFQIHVL